MSTYTEALAEARERVEWLESEACRETLDVAQLAANSLEGYVTVNGSFLMVTGYVRGPETVTNVLRLLAKHGFREPKERRRYSTSGSWCITTFEGGEEPGPQINVYLTPKGASCKLVPTGKIRTEPEYELVCGEVEA